jgi:hypothetical protein
MWSLIPNYTGKIINYVSGAQPDEVAFEIKIEHGTKRKPVCCRSSQTQVVPTHSSIDKQTYIHTYHT